MKVHWRSLSCGLSALVLLTTWASAGGSSVEDLVGIFSVEKTIQLGGGSISSCSGESCRVPDYLAPAVRADPMSDDQPPSLAGLSLAPVEAKGPARSADLIIHVIDDQSGLFQASALFKSPSLEETAEVLFTSGNRTAGTQKDGYYSGQLNLSESCEKGRWLLDQVALSDQAGNSRILSQDRLEDLGLLLTFQVN